MSSSCGPPEMCSCRSSSSLNDGFHSCECNFRAMFKGGEVGAGLKIFIFKLLLSAENRPSTSTSKSNEATTTPRDLSPFPAHIPRHENPILLPEILRQFPQASSTSTSASATSATAKSFEMRVTSRSCLARAPGGFFKVTEWP